MPPATLSVKRPISGSQEPIESPTPLPRSSVYSTGMSRLVRALVACGLVAGCSGAEAPPPSDDGPRIVSFKVSPSSVEPGEVVTLAWETAGTLGVNIEPRLGLQTASGRATDRVFAPTTYVLTIPGGPRDVVAQASVVIAGGPPQVESFTASPRTVALGEETRLEWRTRDAEAVIIEPEAGRVEGASGSLVLQPELTTTYRLTAVRGRQISAPAEVTVVVASGNQPFVRAFSASPQTVQAGIPVTLSWDVGNADRVSLDNGVGPQPISGSVTVTPLRTTTYTLSAHGEGGQVSASVTVAVLGGGAPLVTRFSANPSTIAPGGSAELSWDTDDAEGVIIDPDLGPQPAKGMTVVQPGQTTTYRLTAFGNGQEAAAMTTVTVAAPETPVILGFTAQPSAILEGGSTTLTWSTQNADGVEIDRGVGASLPPSGSIGVTPGQTETYTLTARRGQQTARATVTVTVSPAPPSIATFSAQPASITAGQRTTLSWTTQGAADVELDQMLGVRAASGSVEVSPSQTTTYNLTARGPGGAASAPVTVTVAQAGAPAITSFTATPPQIAPGGQTTLSWSVTNALTVLIDRGIGAQGPSGSVTVSPATTTTYTLTANGPGGQTTAQVTVAVVSVVGNTCAEALVVSASGTFSGNTLTATNEYAASASCTGNPSTGPDVVYRVALSAGDRLAASLNTSWDASLYLVTGCADIAQSCVAGQDNGNPEEIDYTAVSSGTYYLIVDGFGGAGGPFNLSVTLTRAAVPNDTCAGAIDVSQGGVFTGDTTHARNDYTPLQSGFGGCTGYSAHSNDVVYRVTLQPGERVQASLDAAWDSSLYLITDCANASGSCVAGQDNGNPEQIDFTSQAGGTYFLIVDGYGSARGPFTLTVSVSPPVQGGDVCATAVQVPAAGGSFQSTTAGLTNAYQPPAACTGREQSGPEQVYRLALGAGDVVEAVSQFAPGHDGALYAVTDCSTLACAAGADAAGPGEAERLRFVARATTDHFLMVDAASGAGGHDLTVARYTGDTCAQAAPLDLSGVPEWFTTAGRTNSYSPNAGGCTGYTASGPDRAYAVAIQPGDQLQVTATPMGFDTSLYVVSSCANVTGTCVAGSDRGTTTPESVAPVFQQAGTYYVIVDGYAGASGQGTLSAQIRRGETCADAYAVPPTGGTFHGTTAGYTHDLGAESGTGSCTGFSQTGPDAVYLVTLAHNQRINASLNTTWDAALYLITDCAQSATSCVAGRDAGNPETITFQNTSGQARSYYLVVDSWRPSTPTVPREGNYTLTISFQ